MSEAQLSGTWGTPAELNARRVTFASTIEEKTISRLHSVNTSSCDNFSLEDSLLSKEFESKSLDLLELLNQISIFSQANGSGGDGAQDETPSFTTQTSQKVNLNTDKERSNLELKDTLGKSPSADTLVNAPQASSGSILDASVFAPLEADISTLLQQDDKQNICEALSVDIVVDDKDIFTANARIAGVKTPLKGFPSGISLELQASSQENSNQQHTFTESGTLNGTTFSSILFPRDTAVNPNFVSDSQLNQTGINSVSLPLSPPQAVPKTIGPISDAKELEPATAKPHNLTNTALQKPKKPPVLPSPGVFFGARSGDLGSLEAEEEDDHGSTRVSEGRPLFATPATVKSKASSHTLKKVAPSKAPVAELFQSPGKASVGNGASVTERARPLFAKTKTLSTTNAGAGYSPHEVKTLRMPSRALHSAQKARSAPPQVLQASNVLLSSAIILPRRLSEISRLTRADGAALAISASSVVPPSPKTHIIQFNPVRLGNCARKLVSLELEPLCGKGSSSSALNWTSYKIQQVGNCYIYKPNSVRGLKRAELATEALQRMAKGDTGGASDPTQILCQQNDYLTLLSQTNPLGAFQFKELKGTLDPLVSKKDIQLTFRPVKTSGIFVTTFHVFANQQIIVLRLIGIGYHNSSNRFLEPS